MVSHNPKRVTADDGIGAHPKSVLPLRPLLPAWASAHCDTFVKDSQPMSRGRSSFKRMYVQAVKAAHSAGLAVLKTEIATDGHFVLVHSPHPEAAAIDSDAALDRELAEFEARHGEG